MNRPLAAFFRLLILLSLAFCLLPAHIPAAAQTPGADAPPLPAAWMVQLQEPPTAVVYAAAWAAEMASAAQPPLAAAAATTAAQAQLAQISAAQQQLAAQLATLDTPLLFSVQRVYNGMAVLADAEQRAALAQLPGVLAVHPLIPKLPDNSASIPYLGIPALWQGGVSLALPDGLRGEGIRVAVIDTGIDYLHRDFAGPGDGYAQNDVAAIGDVAGYPGPRIVGGHDFVGDTYNASVSQPNYQPIPQPDPDPMDCRNHGTHVAGTLAGNGVTATGATYNGPYDRSTDFAALAIGPGVAPHAQIFALKVFGCTGSTTVTDLALEWAVDPNGDGDFADHMDVVNLSLGSPYGATYDTSAVAADNAALAGVIVVASAGNSGDTQLVTGAPAIADRAISVAASLHTDDYRAGFSSRGPRRGDAALKPDLTAPGSSIFSAAGRTGSAGTSSSGTSMAAPHVAGSMALLRQAHPGWSVEELKALAMNTAAPLLRATSLLTPALELPVRAGAGRIDPVAAAASPLIAYAAGGSGRVSISFGSPAVKTVYTATQQLVIANKSAQEMLVRVSYQSQTQLGGVRVRVPAQPLRVPPDGSVTAPITLLVNAAQIQRLAAPADGDLNGDAWLAEETGYLLLQPALPPEEAAAAALRTLRVPLYAAPRPLAAMTAATTALDFTTNLEQTIALAGSSLQGSAPPTATVALASVLELRLRSPNIRPIGLSPNAVDLFDHADLKYVGVAAQWPAGAVEDADAATIYFGVATWAPWSTPNEIGVNVLIDTDSDGVDDYRLYNFDANTYGGLWFGPAYMSLLQNLHTYESQAQGPLNGVSPSRFDSGLFFQSTLVLPVRAGDLGLAAEHSRISFRIETTSIDTDQSEVVVIDRTPPLTFDAQQPALHFTPPAATAPLWPDAPQTSIGVRLDPAAQARTPAAGVLILHHHNEPSAQASLVAIDYRWPANLYLPLVGR